MIPHMSRENLERHAFWNRTTLQQCFIPQISGVTSVGVMADPHDDAPSASGLGIVTKRGSIICCRSLIKSL